LFESVNLSPVVGINNEKAADGGFVVVGNQCAAGTSDEALENVCTRCQSDRARRGGDRLFIVASPPSVCGVA
jgi:hypothetical protein